jgi:hypothetical protein
MPAINSCSERRSVQLTELNLLLAAVRGSPPPRSASQKVERSSLESSFHRRGTWSSKVVDIAGREIEALCTGRPHDVGCVAGQEQPTEPYRLSGLRVRRASAGSARRAGWPYVANSA